MAKTDLVRSAKTLAEAVDGLSFSSPVDNWYNPLSYAWEAHREYLLRFGSRPKRAVFLGMNPGPWGMAQTGVPFGEVDHVRNWMGIEAGIGKPPREHPKRPVEGFACSRSEVSGRRMWGLFASRFGSAKAFFQEHLVLNYCPLVFMAASGRNITPDKLPSGRAANALANACDRHLQAALRYLDPQFVIGVGAYAEKRLREAVPDGKYVGRILHPSPASPAANRDWAGTVTRQLVDQGVWARH
jgi:single-strand selective monofunctional uracil DNA glycosylase